MRVNRQVDGNQARSKSVVLTALLKNPKTSQIMQSALDSPIGSSYRDQARSMMKSLWRAGGNKPNNINDGKGGSPNLSYGDSMPTYGSNSYGQSSSDNLTMGMDGDQMGQIEEPGTVKMAPSIPAPNAAGSMGSFSSTGSFNPGVPQTGNHLDNIMSGNLGSGSIPSTGSSTVGVTIVDADTGRPTNMNVPGKYENGKFVVDDGFVSLIEGNTKKYNFNDIFETNETGGVEIMETPQTYSSATVIGNDTQLGPANQPADYGAAGQMGGADTTNTGTDGQTDYSSYYDTWYNGLSEDEQTKYKTLYDAVASGIGQSAFAFQMMNDKAALKELFPNVPEEYLPEGALLSGQLSELQETMYEDAGLNKMVTNLNKLKRRGATLPDDLQTYVKSKDTYVKKIDGMLTKAKDKSGTMDMANPHVNKMMNNYMSYLTIIKGRQEKRYIEYMNSSIEQHNADLTYAQDEYKTMYSQYTTEYNNKAAIETEEFNYFKGMLGDMYTNLAGQEAAQNQKLMDSMSMQNASINLLKNQQELTDMLDSSDISDPATKVETDYYTSLTNSLTDESGSYNLGSYYDSMTDIANMGYSESRYKPKYNTAVGKIGYGQAAEGNILGFSEDLAKTIGGMLQSGRDESMGDVNKLLSTVTNRMVSGFNEHLSGDNRSIVDVRDAIKDLVGFSGIGAEYNDDKIDEFIDNNSDKVHPDVLGFIFQNYLEQKKENPGVRIDEIYDLSLSDSGLTDDLVKYYSESLGI